jgi:hypothetical protein
MKQTISNAILIEASQARSSTQLLRFSRRMGLFLTTTLLIIIISAFAFASPAHASGGGCWSYTTWSNNSNIQDNGTPNMYGNEGSSGPSLGLGLNSCQQYIMVKWNDRGYDYYKVDWTRPGVSGWQEFRVSGQSYYGYMYKNFTNAHFGTYYNFAVKGCISHWYGDSCDSWSPTVGIQT